MKDLSCTSPRYRVLFLRFEDALVNEFPCDVADLSIREGTYDQLKRWKKAGYFNYGFLAPGILDRSDLTIAEASALIKKADRLFTSKVNEERFLMGVQVCPHLEQDDCFCKAPTHGLLTQAVYSMMQFMRFQGMVRPVDCIIVGDPKLDEQLAIDILATFLDSDEWLTGSGLPEPPDPQAKATANARSNLN